MITIKRYFTIALVVALCLSPLTYRAQAQEPTKKNPKQTVAPAATGSVTGGGTPGHLSKWVGVSGSTTYVLGDSNIFEDKFGKVGIGTTAPTSPLTVQGMIEITLGGLKFPDGTVQTTAALSSIFHDASLMGNGTQASPLGLANGGVKANHLANGVVVRSLNGLTDNVQLAAGANITITPAGNTLTIAATGALTGVAHDTTLTGNGTTGSPLGVAVPLVLNGSVSGNGVIQVANPSGKGVVASGASVAVEARAGNINGSTGMGVDAFGGNATGLFSGGTGIRTNGGSSLNSFGGRGMLAFGGTGGTEGGSGIFASGGTGSGAGNRGGHGIEAASGPGFNGATDGLAGEFLGNVRISGANSSPGNLSVAGTLSKGAGSFKIDHPLDPENKYLYHSFVESPDMMNIYNGNVTTNESGEAVVELPDFFEALNKDFRYQLTVIGTFAQAIVADEIRGNRFVIRTNAPNVKVSWQVTGIRQDAFANKNRIPVEEEKPEVERGYFLHPDAFHQPEERSINWARNPELMQQLKAQRLEAERRLKQQPHQR